MSFFDKFADAVSRFTSRAWFFAACVLLVLVWAPTFLLVDSVDTWQLLINTPTTIVTFLLVGLSQNTEKRSDDAIQEKLNNLASFLVGDTDEDGLRECVGLEKETGS